MNTKVCINKKATYLAVFILVTIVFASVTTSLLRQKTTYQSKAAPPRNNPQVYGGTAVTDPAKWPFMVHITTVSSSAIGDYVNSCGGTLIAPRWVLTAAHCVQYVSSGLQDSLDKKPVIQIVVGSPNQFEGNIHIYTIAPSEIYTYPNFAPFQKHYINDLALLHVDQSSVDKDSFIDTIPTITLNTDPHQFDVEGSETVVLGWGQTEQSSVVSSMRQGVLPLLSNQRVKSIDSTESNYSNLLESEFAVGYLIPDNGTCGGDSGGPILKWVGQRWIQLGVITWGGRPCGSPNYPSVATRLSFTSNSDNFFKWIQNTINTANSSIIGLFSPPMYTGKGIFMGNALPVNESADFQAHQCDLHAWKGVLPALCSITPNLHAQ